MILYMAGWLLLCLGVVAILLLPFWRTLHVPKQAVTIATDDALSSEQPIQHAGTQQSVALFERRLAALQHDLDQKRISLVEYDSYRQAIEKQLLMACQPPITWRWPAQSFVILLLLLLVLLTFGVYGLIARPHQQIYGYWYGLKTYQKIADQMLTGERITPPSELSTEQSVALFQALLVNAQQHPKDTQRWQILSDVLLTVAAHDQALDVLRRNYMIDTQNERTALLYAQRLIELNEQMPQQAQDILQKLRMREPQNQMATMLLATGYFKNQHYAQAVALLEQIKRDSLAAKQLSSDGLRMLDQTIALAKQKEVLHVRSQIVASIQLSAKARAEVLPESAVYVVVRARFDRIPYAAVRLDSQELLQYGRLEQAILSDDSAMMAQRTLSKARAQQLDLVIEARLSKQGNPIAQPGDWVSDMQRLADKKSYILEINQPFTP